MPRERITRLVSIPKTPWLGTLCAAAALAAVTGISPASAAYKCAFTRATVFEDPAEKYAAKPEPAKAEAAKKEAMKPESAAPDAAKADAGKAETEKAEAKPDSEKAATAEKPAMKPAYDYKAIKTPPTDSKKNFMDYMKGWRGVGRTMAAQKWERYQAMIGNRDLTEPTVKRAFLLAPRQEFARTNDPHRVYAHAVHSIGCGVTISGPHLVGRMTTELGVQPGDKVLEVGTGSGYQSSILSYLTDKVFTIEIIPPLAHVTNTIYTRLTQTKYPEYGNITRKAADGYFGWEEHAPFDRIIVTAGIDHIPPPLLKQLKVGGTMVIPVGTPGSQAVLKVTKQKSESGRIKIVRHDIYADRPSLAGGRPVLRVGFVPFTKYDKDGNTVARWGKTK
jgi:protein-L-isoaspartate(D-aspartate) O-methyltransferase